MLTVPTGLARRTRLNPWARNSLPTASQRPGVPQKPGRLCSGRSARQQGTPSPTEQEAAARNASEALLPGSPNSSLRLPRGERHERGRAVLSSGSRAAQECRSLLGSRAARTGQASEPGSTGCAGRAPAQGQPPQKEAKAPGGAQPGRRRQHNLRAPLQALTGSSQSASTASAIFPFPPCT